MPDLPQGIVAFLFTDIEGSTRLWREHPEAMRAAYVRHDAILRGVIAQHHGVVYKVIGDALQAAFPSVADAIHAATQAQIALVAEPWARTGLPSPLRVRMALHAGAVAPDPNGDYRSPVLNRAGRLLSAGHGGQVLLSQAVVTAGAVTPLPGIALRDLGEHLLKDLEPEHIWQLLHTDLPADFPPLAAPRPENLPLPPTPLIGREPEVARIVELVTQHDIRLVTLLGPGGIGKTRLGLAAARTALPAFASGAFFVPLAALRDPDLIPSTVMAALGLAEEPGTPVLSTLQAHLRARQVLLVLDNAEQVEEGVADVAADLLATCPRLTIMVTSRVALRIRAERVVPVLPLGAPGEADLRTRLTPDAAHHFPAVRLFVDRAQAVEPGFALEAATAHDVGTICARLDGIPLAIELAAAWIPSFSPASLVAQLEQRLALLTDGPRDLPKRQQTLRNTIAWSYDLLQPAEQTLFRRLGVFAGASGVPAVATVADPDGDLIASGALEGLIAHSMLRQDVSADDDAGEVRQVSMLETIHEFAADQLAASGEGDALSLRHAAYYRDLAVSILSLTEAEDVEKPLKGHDLDMERDLNNLRATMTYFFGGGDGPSALRLITALWFSWSNQLGGTGEVKQLLARALASDKRASMERAEALLAAASLAIQDRAFDHAISLIEESQRIAAELDNLFCVARALGALGFCAYEQGDFARSVAAYEDALAIQRSIDYTYGVIFDLSNLASAYTEVADYERATTLLEEAVALATTEGQQPGVGHALLTLGELELRRGDSARAAHWSREALRIWHEIGDQWNIASSFFLLGLASAIDQPAAASRLFGVDEELRESGGFTLSTAFETVYEQAVQSIRAKLGEPSFKAAWAAGRALPLDDAIAEVLRAGGNGAVEPLLQ